MLFAGREGENIDGGDVTSDGRGVLFCRGNDTDLVANAQLFYTLQLSESRVSLVVTTNWFPELRARLAGTK
jgi:hypothetical protein